MSGLLVVFTVESGLHAGGSDTIGTIDEPIQRDGVTGYPIIHGQSVKGAARRRYRRYVNREGRPIGTNTPEESLVFGDEPPGSNGASSEPKPGWLTVGDAVTALFPVPTMKSCYAWVTSPTALEQVHRRARLVGCKVPEDLVGPLAVAEALSSSPEWADEVSIGDYRVSAVHSTAVEKWAKWFGTVLPSELSTTISKLEKDLVVVSDELMRALTQEHTEISARVQLEPDQKTVAHGPFYSEYLPANTVLVARFGTERAPSDAVAAVQACFDEAVWQVGGHESIGKGLVWTRAIGAQA
jgi:CRISPR-associated protein Cmr4